MTAQKLTQDILQYVGNDEVRGWYAGIATNPENRLFNDHRVDKQNGRWIHGQADSVDDARAIESHLHSLGFDGDIGGGDNPQHVYAYKKTPASVE